MNATDKAKHFLDELRGDDSREAVILKMALNTYLGAYYMGDLGALSNLLLGFNTAAITQSEDYKVLEADEIL